jgi:phosphotransferase system  glucose/maltose/N-acetylglucosamine-specific IIC component
MFIAFVVWGTAIVSVGLCSTMFLLMRPRKAAYWIYLTTVIFVLGSYVPITFSASVFDMETSPTTPQSDQEKETTTQKEVSGFIGQGLKLRGKTDG